MRVVFTLALLSVLVSAAGAPASPAPEVDLGLDLYSKYVWRGFSLGDDPVVQPSASVTVGSTSLSAWASYDTGDGDEWTELDYTIEHAFDAGDHDLTAGLTYYTFPNLEDGNTCQDVFLSCTGQQPFPFTLGAYYNYDPDHGMYFELSTERAHGDGAFSLALGYNKHYLRADSGFSHALVSYSCAIPAGGFTVSPLLALSVALADGFDTEPYFGVSVGRAL